MSATIRAWRLRAIRRRLTGRSPGLDYGVATNIFVAKRQNSGKMPDKKFSEA